MNEMICPRCNAQSPEYALYCQQCGQPLRCKNCNTAILPSARACIQCGQLIPERSNNEQFHVGMDIVPPGYNRLKLHETPDLRDLDLTVSNDAIAQIGDLLPSLIGTRLKGHYSSSVDHQTQKRSDLVEVPSDIPTPQPQLPVSSSRSDLAEDSSGRAIWDIFRKQEGGELKLDIPKLRANSKKDYTIRLVYLYLFAKLKLGEKTVSRAEAYTILDTVGLKDGNTANNISQATGISFDDNETLRLNHEGRNAVQQYIADVFSSELTDGWYPGLDTRTTSNRVKKPAKKSSEQHSNVDSDVASWVSHEKTKALVGAIQHSTVVKLSILNKSLFALYGIHKSGSEKEIPVAAIVKYLYKAFKVQVNPQAVSKTFYDERKAKTTKASYVNSDGHGYQITPSGRDYIENLLNLKQPQLAATEGSVGANGAVQQ